MVVGVSAHDMPYKNTTSIKVTSTTASCSGTTTLDPNHPIVTTTVTEYITVTLEPSQVYHPTWKNPLPFCVTVTASTLSAPPPVESSAPPPPPAAETTTATATVKEPVTVIIEQSQPNFEPTPAPAPVESELPPPSESTATEESSIEASSTPAEESSTTPPAETTAEVPPPTSTETPAASFTGGAAGLRKPVGVGEAGAWVVLAAGLLVM